MTTRILQFIAAAIFTAVGLAAAVSIPAALAAEEQAQGPAQAERLATAMAAIRELRPRYTRLSIEHTSLAADEQLERTVINARLQRIRNSLLQQINTAGGLILSMEAAGEDVAAQREALIPSMVLVPDLLFSAIDQIPLSIGSADDLLPPAEQAANYARTSISIARINALLAQVQNNLQLQQRFDLNITAQETRFNERLEKRAAAYAAFLDVSLEDVEALTTQQGALPDDTDITGRLAVARQRVKLSADALRTVAALMKTQELDTSVFDSHLIAVTGEITTDILDTDVIKDLLLSAWETIVEWLDGNGASLIFSLMMFVVIVLITFKLAGIAQRLVSAGLHREQVKLSQLLQRMIISTTRGVVVAIGLLVALSQLGISLGPLLAGLGIAGFVIGFALQDTLSNFASGLMILFYRPFDVGDVIEAGGAFGRVSAMSLVNTTVLTLDHQTLVLPNNRIWGDVIKNLTAQSQRRVDLMFGIGYQDDIPKTEQVLQKIVDEHPLVLADPEPVIRLHELGESSVNFIVRPWALTENYWAVYWDITRAVKMAFDEEGISIPFPQRDVHLYTEGNNGGDRTLPDSDQVTPESK
jgi:small conductance mechanosensitive channel